jgi:hypothetical protein
MSSSVLEGASLIAGIGAIVGTYVKRKNLGIIILSYILSGPSYQSGHKAAIHSMIKRRVSLIILMTQK